MNSRYFLGALALIVTLSACGGELVGVGSLLLQGIQLASGGASESGSGKNSAPFSRIDRTQERHALEDVTSRAVSQSCLAAKDDQADATAAVSAPASSPITSRQCGYRDVCLPGHERPVRMLVCEQRNIVTAP